MKVAALFTLLILALIVAVKALNCKEILQNVEIKYIDWVNLEQCLAEVNSERMPKNTSENVWRLIKIAFDGIEYIPADSYRKLGLIITAIPIDDLRNITMDQVEIVEAFGAIGRGENVDEGLSDEKFTLIAQKVRNEWMGKYPKTYSEYDLISMGKIACYLNVSDIAQIHADAFKEAAEWIGSSNNCPRDRLQAFAKLAKRSDAFGEPRLWSKLEVSIIGNIVNGLSQSDIDSIDKDKLHLNRFYAKKKSNMTKITSEHKNFGNSSVLIDANKTEEIN